jgi:hypothetical protein
MKHELVHLTAEELEAQRLAWIQEYKAFLAELAEAVIRLGKPVEISHRSYMFIQKNELLFYARESSETYDPGAQQFKTFRSILVMAGLNYIANFRWFVDSRYHTQVLKDQICVPGDWMKYAQAIINEAEALKLAEKPVKDEAYRSQLLVKLLNGIDI